VALVKPLIYQVVGYQDSGKTTFINKLINELKHAGLRTVTIKHHGHGGKPDVPQKDSTLHLEAGAVASLVEGDGRLVLQTDEAFLTLDEQIRFIAFFNPDIILIEGHKKQSYPKLLIIRNENDLPLITYVTNIKAVVVWNQSLIEEVRNQLEVPVFHIHEGKTVIEISKELIKLVRKFDEEN
jgi:molybdopterin-guanine dinucleotide biosynthesis adapter protein